MLSTAHVLCSNNLGRINKLYNSTHVNHPSCRWVRENKNTYIWTHALLSDLLAEYKHRYGVHKTHKTEGILEELSEFPELIKDDYTWENPPLCMPDEFKVACPLESYRNYYKFKDKTIKNGPMTWTNRGEPEWFKT